MPHSIHKQDDPGRSVVWVVDDSQLQLERALALLAPHYEVEGFPDAHRMLERLSLRRPALIVLDWHLPELSGLDVCRFLRQQHTEIDLPILMVTVRGAREDFAEGLTAGANDYVAKPYDDTEMLARVRNLVRISKQAEKLRALAEDNARLYQESLVANEAIQKRAGFEQQLIGIVSHDLRNPITAVIMSAATMLRQCVLDERGRRAVGRILSSSERANQMILDLLDFTQARLGTGLPVKFEASDLHGVSRQVVEELQAAHPDRVIRREESGDGNAMCDAGRMSQAISNLLSNAIQYSPAHSPVSLISKGAAGHVVIAVHNDGAPIPANKRENLFEPMLRGSGGGGAVTTRSVGLGLYIVKHIVDAHGGRVSIESDAGTGTTVEVELPRKPTQLTAPGR